MYSILFQLTFILITMNCNKWQQFCELLMDRGLHLFLFKKPWMKSLHFYILYIVHVHYFYIFKPSELNLGNIQLKKLCNGMIFLHVLAYSYKSKCPNAFWCLCFPDRRCVLFVCLCSMWAVMCQCIWFSEMKWRDLEATETPVCVHRSWCAEQLMKVPLEPYHCDNVDVSQESREFSLCPLF